MELNEFDNALKEFTLKHAPKQIAKCGDIVTSSRTWKREHKVLITRVSVEISSIDVTIRERKEKGLTGLSIVQHQYIGRRLKANGEPTGSPDAGFLICEFTTADEQKFERLPSGFNHAGLVFEIENL